MDNRPFWDFLLNFAPVKWFCNLKISKIVMKNPIAQKLFNYEMITYIFYGVATTLLNWVCFAVFCALFGIPMKNPPKSDTVASLAANTIAFIISLIFAFVTNKIIVFKSKQFDFKTVSKEFSSFTVARLLTFALESGIIAFANFIEFDLMIVKIFAGILVVILNYVFSKLFIFEKS